MSSRAFTTMITNHNNNHEHYTEVRLNSNENTAMKTTNVNDRRQYQRDREKGKRENREDDVERTETRRERTRQTNENTHSVTSFTNEQYNCPSIYHSMANYFSSAFFNRPSRIPYFQDYEPSISRYHTSSYRQLDYFEEIISDEILEIINLDHYPTLIERWGDDTKPMLRQEGDLTIEDYVEFEEIEPTITEEISYEILYENDQIKSTKEIHHSYFETRNFRRVKKRRTKRKRPTHSLNEIHCSTYPNDLSGAYETFPPLINSKSFFSRLQCVRPNLYSLEYQRTKKNSQVLVQGSANPNKITTILSFDKG